MPPQRLPIVDSDDGVWGDILRQYLMKEHYNDDTDNAANGGHQTITVRAGTTGAGTAPIKLTSGSLMSSPEIGAIEFLTDDLYFTRTTSTTRDTFVFATHTQTLTNKTLTAPTIGGTSSLTGTLDYTPDIGTILSLDGTAAITRHGGGNSKSLGIGADDTLFLGGGESRQIMSSNITNGQETVEIGGDSGVNIHVSTDNWAVWANRRTTSFTPTGITWNGNTVWHAGNDGTGSGLDADTVDGIQAASFATLTGAETLTNKTITLPSLTSLATPTPTNVMYTMANTAGQYPAFSSVPKYLWHDNLRFNRWTGTPAYETYNGSWSAQTLNTLPFNGKESQTLQLADGATVTAVRWTWNHGNFAYGYAYWWCIGFPYIGVTAPAHTVTIESSSDGSAWTTRHTSTNVNANGSPVWLYESDHGADTYVRLTITSTNSQPVTVSTVKALSPRWGNQGGGSEYEFPYDWDNDRKITIGTTAGARSDGVLNIGTTTSTAASDGVYFGNDTNLYRSAANTLRTDDTLIIGTAGTAAGSAATIDGVQTLTNKTLTAPRIANGGFIADANGNEQVIFTTTASAVNEFTFRNAATTGHPALMASGGDTNISIDLIPKGTGRIKQNGTNVVTVSSTDTLTNKTMDLTSNTLTGTTAQFNTALSDGNFAILDGNNNLTADTLIKGVTWTVASGGTTVLTIDSTQVQAFSGSANQTVRLPTTSVVSGQSYTVVNATNGNTITVQSSNNDVICAIPFNGAGVFIAGPDAPVDQGNWVGNIIGAGAVFAVTNTMTFSGTDDTSMTFPSTNATIARTDAAQTFTGIQTLSSSPVLSTGTVTVGGNTVTIPSAADTLVNLGSTQTLTGKTISGATNTLTALPYDLTMVAFGYVSPRATGTGDFPFGVKLQRPCTLTSVTYRCNTADASGDLVVELRKNGVAVSGSSATIAAASQITGGTSTGSWSFTTDDILTVYVTAVGTTPGTGLIADVTGVTA